MNNTQKKTREKLNNAGFSFVELIVSVVILAIIVIPIYRLFISSATFTNNSRVKMRTTTLATDVMEGLKAYTIEDLKKQFSETNPDIVKDESFRFNVIDETMIKPVDAELPYKYTTIEDTYDFSIADGTAKPKADPLTGKALDGKRDEDGKYYFFIHNIQMQESSLTKYDVRITIDPTGYEKDTVTGDPILHNHAYNSVDYTFSGVNKEKVGIFQEPADVETLLVNEIVDAYYDDTTDDSDYGMKSLKELLSKAKYSGLNGRINRKITLLIEKDLSSNENVLSVTYKYEYPGPDGATRAYDASVDVSGKFSFKGNEYHAGERYTCYFMYYPDYYGIDSFTVKNAASNESGANTPVDFYIVQQANSKYSTDISALENNYSPAFNVTGDVIIHTNLGSSIKTDTAVYTRKDSSTGLPTDATTKADELKWPVQISGLSAYKVYGLGGVPLNAKAESDPMAGASESGVIFDVTVDVFEAVDGDVVLWKTWDRPSDQIVETLQGSMFH